MGFRHFAGNGIFGLRVNSFLIFQSTSFFIELAEEEGFDGRTNDTRFTHFSFVAGPALNLVKDVGFVSPKFGFLYSALKGFDYSGSVDFEVVRATATTVVYGIEGGLDFGSGVGMSVEYLRGGPQVFTAESNFGTSSSFTSLGYGVRYAALNLKVFYRF